MRYFWWAMLNVSLFAIWNYWLKYPTWVFMFGMWATWSLVHWVCAVVKDHGRKT